MTLNLTLFQPLAALIAGILVLVAPRLLKVIIGIYLIIVGISGLWPHLVHGHWSHLHLFR